jgi:hypothetical protein
MRLGMMFKAAILLTIAEAVVLAWGTIGTVQASGYYEYSWDWDGTPPEDEPEDPYPWSGGSHSCSSAGWEGGAHAEAASGGWVTLSEAYPDVEWCDAGCPSEASCASSMQYWWQPDPGMPNEVPPGGTLGYSVSASGSLSATAESSVNNANTYGASASASAYGSGGGSTSGGGTFANGSVGISCSNNDAPSYSYSFSPSNRGRASPGNYSIDGSWSISNSGSNIPIAEGTTYVGGGAFCGGNVCAVASGSQVGEPGGSAISSADASFSADANISISF